MLKLETFREIFIFFFSTAQIWVLRIKKFFFAVFGCFFLLGFGSLDLYIFEDPDSDPGNQNRADPTDLDH